MLNFLILVVLFLLLSFFHEMGHKIVSGKDFVKFEVGMFGWAIYSHSFVLHKTIFEYLAYIMAGWIFSLPVVVFSFFISIETFLLMLAISILVSAVDFFIFGYDILCVVYNKHSLNMTFAEATRKQGLKRWHYL